MPRINQFCHFSMSLLNRVPCVPHVPAWSTCPRVNVPKACQFIIFTYQRGNVPINVSTCQSAKGVPIFQFGVSTFFIVLNICKFLEYSGNCRKFISQKKEFKFRNLQNTLSTRTFNFVFNGAHGINRTIIPVVQIFYLSDFIRRI